MNVRLASRPAPPGSYSGRTHAPRPQNPRPADARRHGFGFVQYPCHFPRLDAGIAGVVGRHRGRADHADRADRDENVAVAGRAQLVDHGIDPPDVVGEHRAPAQPHPERRPRQRPDLRRPGTRRVDGDGAVHVERVTAAQIAQRRADDPPVLLAECFDAVISQEAGAPGRLRAFLERVQQIPRVACAVRHFVDRFELRVERPLAPPRLAERDFARLDADRRAARQPLIDVGLIVARTQHEIAAGRLNRLRRNSAHDAVLVDTLERAFRVAHGVAPARMQQPVIAPARPGSEVAHVGEDHAHAAQRQIPGDAAARRPPADHQYVRFHDYADHAEAKSSYTGVIVT
ncbi:MAG: hypothetical protein U0703_12470 [Anaerolineae bacterium]